MINIFSDLISYVYRVYVDDIGIRALKHDYEGEEFKPGIRCFVTEYLLNINAVLLNCELAGAMIAAAKSY